MAINLARLQPTQLAATSGRRIRVPVKPQVTAELDYNKEIADLEAKKAADLAAMEAETAAAKEKIAAGQALALSELDALAPKQSASTAAVAPQAAPVNLADVSAKKDLRTTSAYEAPQGLSGTQEFKVPDPSRETSGEGPPANPTGTGQTSTVAGLQEAGAMSDADTFGFTFGLVSLLGHALKGNLPQMVKQAYKSSQTVEEQEAFMDEAMGRARGTDTGVEAIGSSPVSLSDIGVPGDVGGTMGSSGKGAGTSTPAASGQAGKGATAGLDPVGSGAGGGK